jgi:hypothetical protein
MKKNIFLSVNRKFDKKNSVGGSANRGKQIEEKRTSNQGSCRVWTHPDLLEGGILFKSMVQAWLDKKGFELDHQCLWKSTYLVVFRSERGWAGASHSGSAGHAGLATSSYIHIMPVYEGISGNASWKLLTLSLHNLNHFIQGRTHSSVPKTFLKEH